MSRISCNFSKTKRARKSDELIGNCCYLSIVVSSLFPKETLVTCCGGRSATW